MIVEDMQQFYQGVAKIFEHTHFDLSTPLLGCGGCFDLIAKQKNVLILVKLLENIDSLREDQAFELRKLSSMLAGLPLLIGRNIRSSSELEDGVIYSRYEIPAISKETLRNLLVHHLPPLIYAHRGGLRIKIDGELLKEKRLEKNLSLSDLASEVGVSKRAIYEYERGGIDVSLDTAMMLEEYLDEPLTIALNLFENMKRIGSVTLPASYKNQPKSDLEKEVKKHFDSIGFKDQLWTRKIPFRVLARPELSDEELQKFKSTITGISEQISRKELVEKIEVTYSISKIAKADPLVVVGEEFDGSLMEGYRIISVDELSKHKKKKKTNDES
ncbi:MAG: transcriptional regulator [Candidatus Heimdallarchaeota archaeon]